jgi:hypothetical protein
MTRVARLSILSILGILCISEIGSTPHASPNESANQMPGQESQESETRQVNFFSRPAMICRCKSLASAMPPEAKASRMASSFLVYQMAESKTLSSLVTIRIFPEQTWPILADPARGPGLPICFSFLPVFLWQNAKFVAFRCRNHGLNGV